MPIYEYVCRHCGQELERLQKLSDASLTDCPECGESALKRKISAAGFRLAGSGWYETDFKSDNRHNLAGDKSAQSSDKNGSGAADSSTPAAKKDTKKDAKKGAKDKKAAGSSSAGASST